MPHLTVEYSANLDARVDIADLVRVVHEAALSSGAFDVNNVRTRAERRDVYTIADGDPSCAFVAVMVHVAKGRDEATRRRIGQIVFDAVCQHLARVYESSPLAISLEVDEIEPISFSKNNLDIRMTARAAKAPAASISSTP